MQAALARDDRAHSWGVRVIREDQGANERWVRFRHSKQEEDIEAAGLGRLRGVRFGSLLHDCG